ncbi:PD-(D/E)XK nuclease family protein [Trichormus sp. NMC-1]|uniref:PDDEXK-like family protein n=1 Tax=Trichormus sp. NMC-1 TaxID=1853259 RepID=UPI0008DC0E7A|nr:PD-(D/E)XK nuclease family protein [Trichormus sp. NMC-1]
MASNKQRELLESFIVDNEDLEELEAKLAEFNIFEAIGVVRQEIRHSNFLAFLLDPSQNHRLDDIFLKRFLKRVLLETDNPTNTNYTKISPVDIDIADLTDSEIRREWQNIDILIHSPRNKLICAIENKIDSGEHSNQLERYQNIIDIEYKNYRKILIYLTPEGSLSSKANWRIYSYSQVIQIIDSICKSYKSILGADIYTLMTHYSTLIRRYIVSDSEIAELCRKIYFKHRQALDLIIEHRPDLQSEIVVEIKKLLNPLIESNEIFADFWNKGYTSFGAKHWENKLGSRVMIYFQFENLPSSLSMRVQIGPSDNKEIRQKIFELLQKQDYSKIFKKTRLSSKWTTIYNKQILNNIDYEDGDIENIIKKIQDFWQDFSKNDFVAIEQIISTTIEMILNHN